jgi:hypothetical protein
VFEGKPGPCPALGGRKRVLARAGTAQCTDGSSGGLVAPRSSIGGVTAFLAALAVWCSPRLTARLPTEPRHMLQPSCTASVLCSKLILQSHVLEVRLQFLARRFASKCRPRLTPGVPRFDNLGTGTRSQRLEPVAQRIEAVRAMSVHPVLPPSDLRSALVLVLYRRLLCSRLPFQQLTIGRDLGPL